MIRQWEEGAEVVHTTRTRREGESAAKMWLTKRAYRVINLLADIEVPENTGDFKLLSRRAVKEVLRLEEHDPFLRGLSLWIGFRQVFFGGLAGFILGLLKATLQDSVETGQVIAGIVRYPVDNPYYMYHLKVFSAVNQFSAFLLQLSDSETFASFVVSGVLGMVFIQALCMIIFAVNRDAVLAVTGGLTLSFTMYLGYGVVYPMTSFSIVNTYGVLGLSYVVLVAGLFGSGMFRAALFGSGSLRPCTPPWESGSG